MRSIPVYVKNRNSEPFAIKAALNFNVIAVSNFPELKELSKKICQEIPGNFKQKATYIETVLCNCANSAYQGKGFYMFRNCRRWSEYNRKHKLHPVSFRGLIRVTDQMEKLGYMVKIEGKHDRLGKDCYATRYFASDALYKIMTKEWANFFCDDDRPAVKVHDDHKNDITPEVLPPEIQEVADNITAQNEFYNHHVTTVGTKVRKTVCTKRGTKYEKPQFRMKDVIEKTRFGVKLQAIYKHDFDHGGRLYSLTWNGMPSYQGFSSNYDGEETKIDRTTIRIDNDPTVEVDYHCLHVNMAYNLCGKEFKGDAYGFLPSRNKAKKTMLIALNSHSEREAIAAIAYYTKVTKEEAISFIEALKAYHTPLRDLLFKTDKCFGLTLQNIDSKIIGNVLKRLREQGIMGLPVHDSIICKVNHKFFVKQVMEEEYKEMMGHPIEVAIK